MRRLRRSTWLLVGLLPGPLLAQASDSTRADSTVQVAQTMVPPSSNLRAAWLSDRLPLKVGDLLTVVIDEQAEANERVSTTASADRALRTQLGIGIDSSVRLGPSKDFSTGLRSSSRDVGESGRAGNLAAVLTVRVVEMLPGGLSRVEGSKSVTVDGRLQEVKLGGIVRSEDVSPNNLISSSRIADASITYKGKSISPKKGILGKILSILWP